MLLASAAFADTKVNSADVDLGVAQGGITIGGAYEHLYNGAQGIGGQLQIFQKDKDHFAPGIIVIGGFTGYHFYKGTWDFSLAPGMNILAISAYDSSHKDTTTFGPSMQIGLTQALNDQFALGFDYANYWVWADKDYRGWIMSTMNVRLKINF
jgi:hypothetical protein